MSGVTVTLPLVDYEELKRNATPRPSNQALRNIIVDNWQRQIKARALFVDLRAQQELVLMMEAAITEALQ